MTVRHDETARAGWDSAISISPTCGHFSSGLTGREI